MSRHSKPKAQRYPKKLRVKLEKVAQKREQREAITSDQTINDGGMPRHCWEEIIEPGSVSFMYGWIDEEKRRLMMDLTINESDGVYRTFVRAPWLDRSNEEAS